MHCAQLIHCHDAQTEILVDVRALNTKLCFVFRNATAAHIFVFFHYNKTKKNIHMCLFFLVGSLEYALYLPIKYIPFSNTTLHYLICVRIYSMCKMYTAYRYN